MKIPSRPLSTILAISAITLLVFLVLVFRNDPRKSNFEDTVSIGVREGRKLPDGSAESGTVGTQRDPVERLPSQFADDALTETQLEVIKTTVAAMQDALHEIERKNSSIVYSISGDKSAQVIVEIARPTSDQLKAVTGLAESARQRLGDSKRAEKFLSEQIHAIVRETTFYPQPVKVLRVRTPVATNAVPRLTELFVPSLADAMPQPDGSFVLPDRGNWQVDDEWGQAESWGTKRYGHLFEIDRATSQPHIRQTK